MDTTFQKVVVLGYGKVTGEVLQYVCDRRKEYGYEVEFIEHETHSLSVMKKIWWQNRISRSSIFTMLFCRNIRAEMRPHG